MTQHFSQLLFAMGLWHRMGKANNQNLLRARAPYLLLAGLPFVLGLFAFLLVALVDPYDLRPWGARPAPASFARDANSSASLLNVVAASDVDLLLIGGSTVNPIDPALLKAAFPESGAPFNISYNAPRFRDLDLVFNKVVAMPRLQRVIVGLDSVTFFSPAEQESVTFPFSYYDTPWYNIGKDFEWTAISQSARLALGLPGPRQRTITEIEKTLAAVRRLPDDAQKLNFVKAAVAKFDRIPAAPAAIACEEFTALRRSLLPFAKSLSQRNIKVDILVPPYALVFYPVSQLTFPVWALKYQNNDVLELSIRLRECAVEDLAAVPGVRVHAFDNERQITEVLANYRDPGHMVDAVQIRWMLDAISRGSNTLTRENFSAYAQSLRERVRHIELTENNSP